MAHKHQAGIKTKTCNKTLFKFCPESEHVQQLKHRNNMASHRLVFTRMLCGCVDFVLACTGQSNNNQNRRSEKQLLS